MKRWNSNLGFLIILILCMVPFTISAENNREETLLGQPWHDERSATKGVISPGSYLYGNPSAAEQAHLERINRARLNPQAEANRLLGGNINEGLPSGTITTTAKQPLTFNSLLYNSAKAHSQDMIARDYFSHYSLAPVTSPFDRMTAAGYTPYTSAGENIAITMATYPLNEVDTILGMHDNFVIDSSDPNRGHRVSIFNANFKEIGIGSATGSYSTWPYALTLTCDFGARSSNSFVLGVVYDDTSSNGYNAGEGIGGAVISVVRSNGDTASTTTASAGGYGIPLPDGSYTITARLADDRELTYPLTISGQNVKIDFEEADFPSSPPPPDSIPNQFTFTDQTNVQLSTVITSNTITISGINTATPISITGGTYSINGGSYTSSSGTVNNGNTVTVRQTSSGSNSTTTNAMLTIGGVSDTFSVTTLPPAGSDTTPNPFTFTDRTNVTLSTVITSNTITVSGINAPVPISITGGTYSINGGSYTSSSGTVNNGNTVTVRQTSSGSNSTTTNAMLTIGGVSDTFSVTTLPPAGSDTTPNPFTFTDRTNVALSTVITSNTITVSGIDTATPISITGGTYSINSGSYTSSSGTVNNGNTITVQLTSSGNYSTTTNATLTIGGISDTFSLTTPTSDMIPAQFTFTDQTNVQLSTVITSNTVTISGINTAAPISITGGTYSINSGSYTSSSGTVNNGDALTVRQTSSGNYSTKTDATINIGGVFDTFSVITKADPMDTPPDQFTFTDQTDVALSTVITSNTITVTGITSTTPISITGGEYSINGGPYTSTDGTVNPEDTVTVQQTSSESYSTITDTTLIIGGISDTFSVTTISGSSGGGGEEGGGGGCFIATAAFGSPLAGQVEILRQFRDRYLLTNELGQKFVVWYYSNGPSAANYIKDKPFIKAAVRVALYPLIGFSLMLISGYLPFVTVGLLLSALLFLRFKQKYFSNI